jgi:hypothetical protein
MAMRGLLERIHKNNLAAIPSKCYIGCDSLECFGHEVGEDTQRPNPSKEEAIRDAPIPFTKKQVRSFLGLIGFYHKFIPNFAEIALSLTYLMRKG